MAIADRPTVMPRTERLRAVSDGVPSLVLRVGLSAAVAGLLLGAAYLAVMLALALTGAGFPPPEPYATVVGIITLLLAPGLVILMAALHEYAPASRKVLSLTALAMTIIFAVLTSINRFVQLTVVRQSLASGHGQGLELFLPYGWPSVMLALELLAWGGFLGLALIFAGPVFLGGRLGRVLCGTLVASGGLCLMGSVGQAIQQPGLVWLGLMGWGPGLMIGTVLMAIVFYQQARAR